MRRRLSTLLATLEGQRTGRQEATKEPLSARVISESLTASRRILAARVADDPRRAEIERILPQLERLAAQQVEGDA